MNLKNLIDKIALSILGIFLFQSAFCQENYLTGFVVLSEGDTLHGFVDYRGWDRSPDYIFFKMKLIDDKTEYTPIDIKGFSVHDEIYESAKIKTELNYTSPIKLDNDATLEFETKICFIQPLIKGQKSLYLYKDKYGKNLFFIKQDSSYELLIYKKFLNNQEGNNAIAENKKYIGQLNLYLQDCQSIQTKLKNIIYTKDSLEKLFRFYYECAHSDIKFQKKTDNVSTEFGVLAGLSLTSLKFRGNVTYLTQANYHLSENFTAGVFFDLILPRNQGKWSINNELIFTSYNVNGSFNDYKYVSWYTLTYTKIGYSYLNLTNMLRFKYPIGRLFVYLNAGISNGVAISETNYSKSDIVFTTERIEIGKALNDTRKFEQAYILGLGTRYRKYSFDLRYEMGNGMSKNTGLSSTTNRYYFLLGYRF